MRVNDGVEPSIDRPDNRLVWQRDGRGSIRLCDHVYGCHGPLADCVYCLETSGWKMREKSKPKSRGKIEMPLIGGREGHERGKGDKRSIKEAKG